MANTIFFAPLFIKLSGEKYVTCAIAGTSNTRYSHNNAVCRDFNRLLVSSLEGATKEEILAAIEQRRAEYIEDYDGTKYEGQEVYNDNHFGWFSGLQIDGHSAGKTTFSMYRNFFKRGMNRAATIEQYVAKLGAGWFTVYGNGLCGNQLDTVYFRTESEYLQALEKLNGSGNPYHLNFSLLYQWIESPRPRPHLDIFS